MDFAFLTPRRKNITGTVAMITLFGFMQVVFVAGMVEEGKRYQVQYDRMQVQCEFISQAGGDPTVVERMADDCLANIDARTDSLKTTVLLFMSLLGVLAYLMYTCYEWYRHTGRCGAE